MIDYIVRGILCFTDGERPEIEDDGLYSLYYKIKGIEKKKQVKGRNLSATIRREGDGCFGKIEGPIKQGVRI